MLLLVGQAQVDQVAHLACALGRRAAAHRGVHVGAIGQHLVERGAGEQAARGPRMPRPRPPRSRS